MRAAWALAVFLSGAIPAAAGHVEDMLAEAARAARSGRAVEACEIARHAAQVADEEPELTVAVAELEAAARVLAAGGDAAGAAQARRTRTRRVVALVRGALSEHPGYAEVGIALAGRAHGTDDAALARLLATEALRFLDLAPAEAPRARGARGLALERLGRTAEAWPLLVAEARADKTTIPCRVSLARIAIARGRPELAARALAPRAGAPPNEVMPALASITRSLCATGHTTQATQLAEDWITTWTSPDQRGHLQAFDLAWGWIDRPAGVLRDLAEAELLPEYAVERWLAGYQDRTAPDAALRLVMLRSRLSQHGLNQLNDRLAPVEAEFLPPEQLHFPEDDANPPGPGEVIVRFGTERVTLVVRTGTYRGAPPQSPELGCFAAQVRRALAAYPDGMAERLGLKRMVLTRGLLDRTVMVAAHADSAHHEIAARWDPRANAEEWAARLHHEIGHFVDAATLRDDPEWTATNAPGWRYTGNYSVYSQLLPQASSVAPGIATEYAGVAPAEDKAVLWSALMVYGDVLEERAAKDPYLAAKVKLLKERGARLLPQLDAGFFAGQRSGAGQKSRG